MDALTFFANSRLVPVVVIEQQEAAVDLAKTLRDAGMAEIEVTLRTADALDAIETIANSVPDIRVGAGSIRSAEQIKQAQARGAAFLVSPGSSPGLLQAAAKAGLPFVPGAETASEMQQLLDAGYRLQKFFPAEVAGGVAKLRAISAPMPELRFFPTGGITFDNAADYLALETVCCVGGSWFVPREALSKRDFAAIATATRKAVAALGKL
ncbi:MAG: bifunctional 4-hydroxy-2-oxoglutarate aldolase/2-dehydro-3-deoxy-phosphogluconate aldolase [Pseudohongiellaceae bacterium]